MATTPSDHDPSGPSGNRPLRIVIGIVLAIVVVVVLFTVVFPWVNEYQNDPTLEGAPAPLVATAMR